MLLLGDDQFNTIVTTCTTCTYICLNFINETNNGISMTGIHFHVLVVAILDNPQHASELLGAMALLTQKADIKGNIMESFVLK